jgi:acyl-CoA reductase-like NAD-dependent aldehyde dehydrogenase
MSRSIKAGTEWITFRAYSALAPFGRMKHSGLGRESGQGAIHEFLEIKSVWTPTAESGSANNFMQR